MKLKENKETLTININNKNIDIPKDWKIKKIRDIFKVKNGDLILENQLLEEGTYPVYSATAKDIVVGYIDSPKTVLRANLDIIVPSRGFSLGNAKLPTVESTSTQTTIMLISKTDNEFLSRYVTNYLKANRKTLFRDTKGTAILQINRREIEEIDIPMPQNNEKMSFISDIMEQQEDLISLKEKEVELEKQKLIILQREILSGRIMG